MPRKRKEPELDSQAKTFIQGELKRLFQSEMKGDMSFGEKPTQSAAPISATSPGPLPMSLTAGGKLDKDPATQPQVAFTDNKHLAPLEPFDELARQQLGATPQGQALPPVFEKPSVVKDPTITMENYQEWGADNPSRFDETEGNPEGNPNPAGTDTGQGISRPLQLMPPESMRYAVQGAVPPNTLENPSEMTGQDVDPSKIGREPASLRAGSNVEAAPGDVVPPPERQMQSNVLFDMFNVVPPGFGLGSSNKLFVENEQRDEFIRYRGTYTPRMDNGPPTGIVPNPWQSQDAIPKTLVEGAIRDLHARVKAMEDTVKKAMKTATVGTLPTDVNDKPSSMGLPRRKSCLQPVHDNIQEWTPNVEPAGVFLNTRGFRHLHSAFNYPERTEVDKPNGGPVLRRRRALEVNLP